jgi:UDP-N-acetylmuramate dehydrogenase
VAVADRTPEIRVIPVADIPFSYRHSGLEGMIVLEAEVRLRPGDPGELSAEVQRLFAWRQAGTPFNQPCCGSVFKNPAGPAPAGWQRPWTAGALLEAAGLKGTRVGDAEVSGMHANYFVNNGAASAHDVLRLIGKAREVVREKFGVSLETEVKVIGVDGENVTSDQSPVTSDQ